MKAIVAEHGQATIPKPLRDKLGVRPGTTLEFGPGDGVLVTTRVSTDSVSAVFGRLGRQVDTDWFVRRLREALDE